MSLAMILQFNILYSKVVQPKLQQKKKQEAKLHINMDTLCWANGMVK